MLAPTTHYSMIHCAEWPAQNTSTLPCIMRPVRYAGMLALIVWQSLNLVDTNSSRHCVFNARQSNFWVSGPDLGICVILVEPPGL